MTEGVTTTTLDKLGRSTSEKAERDGAPSEPETTTTYNHLGWVLESVDANGVTTSSTYDAHGAVTSQTIGSRATSSAYHAVNGRLLSVTNADGAVITYAYDAFGRAVRELHTSGAVTLKDLGGTLGRTIDSLGRTTAETEAVSGVARTWTFPVNAATGTQETISYGGSPATSLAVIRSGREMETARTATIAAGVTVTLATSDTTTGRDTADRWTQRTITQSGRAARAQNRSFDAAGRYASQSGLGFTSGQSATYAYDVNSGRRSAEDLPLAFGGTISGSFAYYAGGRLAKATTNGVEESFTFDEVGNLVLDAITDVGETQLSYDAASRLTSSAYAPALDGATTATTYYGWDAANAWRTCQGPDPSATQANEPIDFSYNAQGRMSSFHNDSPLTDATYTYDAAGQRTKSVAAVAGASTTTSFAYDGLTLLRLSATQGATTWRIDYLYDEEGAPYGGVYRSPSPSTSPTYFTLVTTGRGDVVALCDADGVAFAAYRYDAWGSPQGAGSYATGVWTQGTTLVNATLAGQIASRQILRYAGYAYDAESGLYYCSARYYDPATRQWTSGDPAKADGEESAYQYCGGDPVGTSDAYGMDSAWLPITNPRHPFYHKTARQRVLMTARKLVGTTRTKVLEWCKRPGDTGDWCADAVSYVGASAWSEPFGSRHPEYTWRGPGFDNCGDLHDVAVRRKFGMRWIPSSDRSGLRNGDLVIYNWGEKGKFLHVGIVIDKSRRRTIEGNRKSFDALRRIRPGTNPSPVWKSEIAGFIRVTR